MSRQIFTLSLINDIVRIPTLVLAAGRLLLHPEERVQEAQARRGQDHRAEPIQEGVRAVAVPGEPAQVGLYLSLGVGELSPDERDVANDANLIRGSDGDGRRDGLILLYKVSLLLQLPSSFSFTSIAFKFNVSLITNVMISLATVSRFGDGASKCPVLGQF